MIMKPIALLTILVAAASAYSYNKQPEFRVQSQSYEAPSRVIDVPTVRVEMNSGSNDYQTQAPAPVRASYNAPQEIRVQSYDAPAVRSYESLPAKAVEVPTVRVEMSSSSSDYQPAAPAVRSSYDAPEIRVQSSDYQAAPAPVRSSYESFPARAVEVPTVRVEMNSANSDYQAPKSSYNAPQDIRVQSYDSAPAPVRSSYELPAVRSYEAPARVVDVPTVRVEMSGSDYQAPQEIRASSYAAPQPQEIRVQSSDYQVAAPVRSSYEAPKAAEIPTVRYELSSADYQAPLRSTYAAPEIRVQSSDYQAPAPVRSSYDAPARVVEVPTVRVEMNSNGYESPALKSDYAAPATVIRSSGY